MVPERGVMARARTSWRLGLSENATASNNLRKWFDRLCVDEADKIYIKSQSKNVITPSCHLTDEVDAERLQRGQDDRIPACHFT